MTGETKDTYTVTVTGLVNGDPHTVRFDTRDVLVRRAELAGETLSEEQLCEDGLKVASDIRRVQEALAIPRPLRKTLASRIGSIMRKL